MHIRATRSARHRLSVCCCKSLAAACWLLAAQAHADLLDNVDQLRHRDCPQSSKQLPRLRHSSGLDAVAREWSKGIRLTEAVDRTNYPTAASASMQVANASRDVKITQMLRDNYCSILTNASFSEIGLFRRDAHVWIVVAAPLVLPASSDAAAIRGRVLELVNQARSQARTCGATAFGAAPPLRASTPLANAAAVHAQDMARHNHFQHQGTDGSTPGERASRAGYRWSTVAENIAAGITTADEVVRGWLESPGHCVNIMRPQFTEMGVAYVIDLNRKPRIYWAQEFGQPR